MRVCKICLAQDNEDCKNGHHQCEFGDGGVFLSSDEFLKSKTQIERWDDPIPRSARFVTKVMDDYLDHRNNTKIDAKDFFETKFKLAIAMKLIKGLDLDYYLMAWNNDGREAIKEYKKHVGWTKQDMKKY